MLDRVNFIKNIIVSNFQRLSYPYKIAFALTYACNLRCKICRIWENSDTSGLGIEEIERVFKSAKNLNWLDLTGGELTLREDLCEIIKVIARNANRLVVFHLSSNGQLPERLFNAAKEAVQSKLIPIVNVSIDGPRKKNDELKGQEGAFSKSIESFKLLKSLKKGYYYLSCTISDYNAGFLRELVDELNKEMSDFDFSDLHFNIFHNSSHYYNNKEVYGLTRCKFDDIKEYLSLSKKGNPVKKILEARYIESLNCYLSSTRYPLKCQALLSSCFINPYGDVYPCGIYDRPIGNLKDADYNLEKLWDNIETIKIREAIDSHSCPGCWSPCEAYPSILSSFLKA